MNCPGTITGPKTGEVQVNKNDTPDEVCNSKPNLSGKLLGLHDIPSIQQLKTTIIQLSILHLMKTMFQLQQHRKLGRHFLLLLK